MYNSTIISVNYLFFLIKNLNKGDAFSALAGFMSVKAGCPESIH